MITADMSRTCDGCSEIQDELWSGTKRIAHRCMAIGECQGRIVGFDTAWNNLIPAWCPKRPDGGGLHEPERKQSRADIQPGAMDAPKGKTMAAANQRWRDMRSALEAELTEKERRSS